MKPIKPYWEKLFHDFPDSNGLKIKLSQSETSPFSHYSVIESPILDENLPKFCQDNQIEISSILQASWYYLLSYYCINDEVIFSSIYHNHAGEKITSIRLRHQEEKSLI